MQHSYASRAPSPRPRVNAAWCIRLRLCPSCSSWCFMFLPDGLTLMLQVQNLNLSLHCTATICKTISQVLWLQDNIPEKVDQLQRHVSNWVQEKNATPNSPSLMFSFPLRCSRWATFCPVRIEFRSSQTWKTGFRFQKHHSSGWFKRGKKHQQTQLLIPWIKQRIKTHTHTCFRHFLDTRDVFFIFMIPVKNHCRWSPKTTNGSATTPWAAVLPGRRPSCRVCYWTWPMASSLITTVFNDGDFPVRKLLVCQKVYRFICFMTSEYLDSQWIFLRSFWTPYTGDVAATKSPDCHGFTDALEFRTETLKVQNRLWTEKQFIWSTMQKSNHELIGGL